MTARQTALVLVAAGVALAAALACTASQARRVAAVGAVTVLDCEAAHLDPVMLGDAKALAAAALEWLITGTAPTGYVELKAQLKAELAPIRSDLGRCGVAGAIAAATAAIPSEPGVATSALTAAPDPAVVLAAWAGAARELGWAPVRLPGGEVL